jgi:Aspartyl protease
VPHEIIYHHRLAYDISQAEIILPVIIDANGHRHSVTAALDTGATLCVFQREIAESLGIAVEEGIKGYVSAMGTVLRVYGHEATLTIGDLAVNLFIYFPEFQMIPRNLLGRQGFLQRLRLGLNDYEGLLYLSPYNDP